jgi:hypothetical protein
VVFRIGMHTENKKIRAATKKRSLSQSSSTMLRIDNSLSIRLDVMPAVFNSAVISILNANMGKVMPGIKSAIAMIFSANDRCFFKKSSRM